MTGTPAVRAEATGGTLTIVCGGGDMPLRVARSAARNGWDVFLLGIASEADKAIEAFPHAWLGFDQIGRFFEVVADAKSSDLVIIGKIRRPDIKEVKFDFRLLSTLPRLLLQAVGSDDTILSAIVRAIESKGIRVHGAHDVAPDLLLARGNIGRNKPNRQERSDIAIGCRLISTLAEFDIGQAVVVRKGRVVAIEAAEGTDEMLRRCAETGLRHRDQGGVLIKLPKPGQELRVDMPTIGAGTIEAAARAGLTGIAASAGQTLVAGMDEMREAANRVGLFVAGLDPATL